MLNPNATQDLRARLRGALLLPGDPGYDDARSIWNAMIDRRPALIVRCLGVTDVVTGVNFAREHNLPLSIKSGGHNISGLAVWEGGLMLDMSLMRGVWVDPTTRTARAQAGCLLGDLDRETDAWPGRRARLRFHHRHRRPHAGRRLRLPHPPLRLDVRHRPLHGGRHRRRTGGARQRTGEQ